MLVIYPVALHTYVYLVFDSGAEMEQVGKHASEGVNVTDQIHHEKRHQLVAPSSI